MNITHEQIKQEWRQQVEKIRHPTPYCQACLGQNYKEDHLITCGICQSSIHKSHYAYELVGKTANRNHITHNLDDWRCQRCRFLIEKRFALQVKCEFCPFPRGIMKKVIYQFPLNNRKEIWVHPQCTTWCFPLIWMQNLKRTHYFKETPNTPTTKFWFRVEDQPTKKCLLCSDNYGYKIKCTFYSCQKFYHITCAKKIGVVRDLESMRFQPHSDDLNPNYCPIYCQQHLQAYVLDFGNRIKLYSEKKDPQKLAHFTKLHNCYKIQLKNLTTSAKRAKQQQEIRNQFGKQLMIGAFEESSMSLSISQGPSNQMVSSDSESHSSTFLTFLEQNYELKDLERLLIKKRELGSDEKTVNKVREGKHEKKTTKKERKNKIGSSEGISEEVEKIVEEQQGEGSMELQVKLEKRARIGEAEGVQRNKQDNCIVEEKEVVYEEKYIKGAYKVRNENACDQIRQKPQNQMEEEGINENFGEQQRIQQFEHMVQECEEKPEDKVGVEEQKEHQDQYRGIKGDQYYTEQQVVIEHYSYNNSRRSERQLSEGQMSEQILLDYPGDKEYFDNQGNMKEQKEKFLSQNAGQKMEQENNLRQDQLNIRENPQLLNQKPPHILISRQTQQKTLNISKSHTNTNKKKSRSYIDQQFSSPSSPQSDQSYNPHK